MAWGVGVLDRRDAYPRDRENLSLANKRPKA